MGGEPRRRRAARAGHHVDGRGDLGGQRCVVVVALGPEAIEQFYQNEFKMGPLRRQSTLDEVSPLGNDAVIGRGEFHVTGQSRNSGTNADGHWAAVYVREGGTWKIRLLTQVRNAPPLIK